MALGPFREINRRLAGRSIRISISPTPSTFAERRSILQVLKKYGKIDVFKREDQRGNRYISIARTDETATMLIQMSPIACRVSLPRIEHDKRARQLQQLTEPAAQPKIDYITKGEALPSACPQEQQQQQKKHDEIEMDFETREFELTIVPARNYDHGMAATTAVEYPRWPQGYEADRSFAALTLQDTLPESLLKEGLSHWHVNPALGTPRDSMGQRLERRQQVPGQMMASSEVQRGND